MNIGIIVYSQTGNTYDVAEGIRDALETDGHEVRLERVVVQGNAKPGSKDMDLASKPDVEGYDHLIFGSPVQAFSLAAAMDAYLNQIASLEGQDVSCFVTKRLAFAWTGGSRSLRQMERICQAKGARVTAKEIVFWGKKRRDATRRRCIENLCRPFAK